MHYYQFNIKSYHADTVHLSNEEDICYRRLLDMYYDTEQSIPTALPPLTRRLRVGLPELETVLNEFFVLTEKGWINYHCEHVIAEYNKFIDKQRANGCKGGKPKKPTANPPLTQALTNNKLETINNNQETINQENQNLLSLPAEKPPKADPVPYQKIIDLYHQKLPTCPKVALLTDRRKQHIAARWKSGLMDSLEEWEKLFDAVAQSKFLTGGADPSNGHKRFVADIEWLANENNIAKVAEGKYL